MVVIVITSIKSIFYNNKQLHIFYRKELAKYIDIKKQKKLIIHIYIKMNLQNYFLIIILMSLKKAILQENMKY